MLNPKQEIKVLFLMTITKNRSNHLKKCQKIKKVQKVK